MFFKRAVYFYKQKAAPLFLFPQLMAILGDVATMTAKCFYAESTYFGHFPLARKKRPLSL